VNVSDNNTPSTHDRAMSREATHSARAPGKPTRAKMLVQVVGFILGCVLIGWCIQRAWKDGGEGLAKLRAADPTLVSLLLLSTLGSIICSGLTFWSVVRPIRRVGNIEMQAVNLMATLFNYAPIRLGLALRCAYHWRVDRMPATDIAAWITGVAIVTLGTLGAGLTAGLIQIAVGRETLALDWLWFLGFVGVIVVGSTVTMLVGRSPLLRRVLKGGERVLVEPRALFGGIAFRTIDLAMWAIRMWAAAKIVGVSLGPAQAAMLAAVAILGAGNPLGRIGWREGLVALVAPYVIASQSGDSESLDALTAQLALLESAGEAIISLPLGVVGAIWCARRLKRVPSAT
jgi:hypothetical protein